MNRHERRKALRLGATGQFPDGKISKDDEGELQMAIYQQDGQVHIDFGKLVSWVAFPPPNAVELAKTILKHAGAKKITVEF